MINLGKRLICVDDKFSMCFKSHLGEDSCHKYFIKMVQESKYCSRVMKKCFYKEPEMTKIDDEDFESFTKCWICDKTFVDSNVKVSGHCHITGKYRDSAHRDFSIKLKLKHENPWCSTI